MRLVRVLVAGAVISACSTTTAKAPPVTASATVSSPVSSSTAPAATAGGATTAPGTSAPRTICPSGRGTVIGHTVDPLDEVSGLTSSPSGAPVLWAHNDSGDKARLFALSSIDGAILGEVQLTGAAATDWEDITAYRAADGTPTLIVADTGDNNAVRPEVHLYLLPEPAPVTTKRAKAARVTLRFDEGPHDVEAVAVDAEAGELLIVGKRFGSSRTVDVHVVALADLVAGATLVATTVGRWTVPIGELYGPTGADVSDDGQVLAVRLPFGIVTWNRRPGTSFARLLVDGVPPDCRLSLGSGQLESVTFLPDRRMVTVSEGVESDLVVSEPS